MLFFSAHITADSIETQSQPPKLINRHADSYKDVPHLSGVNGSSVLLPSSFFMSMKVGVSLYALKLKLPWVVLNGSASKQHKKHGWHMSAPLFL